jgi:hypothetical protein
MPIDNLGMKIITFMTKKDFHIQFTFERLKAPCYDVKPDDPRAEIIYRTEVK